MASSSDEVDERSDDSQYAGDEGEDVACVLDDDPDRTKSFADPACVRTTEPISPSLGTFKSCLVLTVICLLVYANTIYGQVTTLTDYCSFGG